MVQGLPKIQEWGLCLTLALILSTIARFNGSSNLAAYLIVDCLSAGLNCIV